MIANEIKESEEISHRAKLRENAAEQRALAAEERATQAVRDERKIASVRIAAQTRNVECRARRVANEFAQLESKKRESEIASNVTAKSLEALQSFAATSICNLRSEAERHTKAVSLADENIALKRRCFQAESKAKSLQAAQQLLKEQLDTTNDALRTSECLRSEEEKKSSKK